MVTKTTTETVEKESPFGKFNLTADVTTTETCDNEGCFEEKFKNCTPSKLTADAGIGAINYEIIGPVATGCSIRSMFTTNPNPEWENKEMICTYDNSVKFITAVEEVFTKAIEGETDCTGPLYEIISSL